MATQAHRIFLRGPWQGRVVDSQLGAPSGPDSELRRVIPTDDMSQWLGHSFCGKIELLRRFGRPTGLEAETSVQLVIDQFAAPGFAQLNERNLGQFGSGEVRRFEIADRLQLHNLLRVEIALSLGPAPPSSNRGDMEAATQTRFFGEVRLEIRDTE